MFSQSRNNRRVHFSTVDTVYTFTKPANPTPAPRTSSRRRRASMPAYNHNSIKAPPPYLDSSDYTSDDSSSSMLAMKTAPQSYASIPLHFLLAFSPQPPYLDFDVSQAPTSSAFLGAPMVLAEPATSPPLSALVIRCPNTPWTISVQPSYSPFVTVWDVLEGIYSALRHPVTPDEYAALPSHDAVKRVNSAYRSRHSHIEDPQRRWKEEQKGVKRVDFLQGMNRFIGLTMMPDDHPGVWSLVVSH